MHKNKILIGLVLGALLSVGAGVFLTNSSREFVQNDAAIPTFQVSQNPSFDLLKLAGESSSLHAALLNADSENSVSIESVSIKKEKSKEMSVSYHLENGSQNLVVDSLRSFVPGLYTLIVSVRNSADNSVERIEQDFAWGVLAMNADKDEYQVGERAALHFGVLNDLGEIVCDADLRLTVTKPNHEKLELGTFDGSIAVTNVCGIKKAMLIDPDYEAFMTFDQAGTYTFDIVAETPNGVRSMQTTISTVDNPEFSIQRKAATRLWPEGPSTMEITVTFNKNFAGTITDVLPAGFELVEATPQAKATQTSDGTGTVLWSGAWASGEIATFTYTYDAPDISPQFYLLGPVVLESLNGKTHTEKRAWQIANDDTSERTPNSVEDGCSGCSSAYGEEAWTDPSNGGVNDNAYATVHLDGSGNQNDDTHLLVATQYGFNLSNGSTIQGVTAKIRKHQVVMEGDEEIDDQVVRLVIAGSGAGTNKSVNTVVSTTGEREDSYGGAADLWGIALTENIVENTAFGLMYAANIGGGNGDESDLFVDSMSLTVHYTPGVGGGGGKSISGRVYSTDAPSGLLSTKAVTATSEGVILGSDTTDSQGFYSITDLTLSTGAVVSVFLENENEDGVLVTLGSGSSMTGMNIYQDHLILRSDSGSYAMTNTKLDVADNYNDLDQKAIFNVTNGILNMNTDKELFIWSGDTYAPGGLVKTHDLEVRGTMTMSTNGLTVTGSMLASAGTFTTSTGVYLFGEDDNETLTMGSNALNNVTFDSGLVGYWKFDEGTGNIVENAGYYGYDGTFSFGGRDWTTTVPSRIQFFNPFSMDFNGSNTYLTLGNRYDQTGDTPFSISAWVNMDTAPTGGANYMIVTKASKSSPNAGYALFLDNGRRVNFTITNNSSNNRLFAWAGGVQLSTGTWYHVVVTYNGNKLVSGVHTYLDSANLVNTPSTDTLTDSATNTAPFQIGALDNGDSPFNGKIDDVRFYDRQLSHSEVVSLYNGNQATGSGRYVLGSALQTTGALKIYGSTLDVSGSNYGVTVGGSWMNYGGFTKQSGTVTLNGTNQVISGSTVFHNFSKAVTSADSAYFDWKGRQSVSGSLVLNGAVGQLLTLRSTKTGSGWNILLDGDSGTQTIHRDNVRDSDASGGQQLVCFGSSEGCVDATNNTNWFFTQIGTGTVKGTLWNDLNGNGVKNVSETTGFSGISVALTGTATNGALVSSGAVTNASGVYYFSGALVSNPTGYTVTVASIPTGYLKTRGTSSGNIVLGTGAIKNVNFGFVQASTISGAVFVDLNQNGLKDGGETSVFQNIVMSISGTSASGNTVTGSQTTNSSGIFAYRNLGPSSGNYTVSVVSGVPVGYSSRLFTSSGMSIAQGNTHITTANFGYMWYGNMSGVVFIDSDEDAVLDAGEAGRVSGVTIALTGTTSSGAALSKTTTTTSTGAFFFRNIPISTGNYTVTMTTPSGYQATTSTNFTRAITAGAHAPSTAFGLETPTTIAGTVYTNQGITPIGSNKKVSISLNGGAISASGFTTAGGSFTINSFSISHGQVMTVFLDDETENAALVTIATGSNMTGVHLFGDHLLIRNFTGGTITSTHLATADNSADSDITGIFTSASSAAVTVNSTFETLIWTGTTYVSQGTFTGGDIEVDGTWSGGGALSVRDIDLSGSLSPGSTIHSRNITIDGSLSAGGAISASGVVVQGTLTSNNNNVTMNKLTASGTLTLGSSVVTVRGKWNTGDATFTSDGHVHFIGTGSTFVIVPGSNSFEELTTSGSYILGGAIDIDGSYALSGGTLDVTANNYGITIGRHWNNVVGSGAFLAHSGSVVFNGTSQRLLGSNLFNAFSKIVTASNSLTIEAGKYQYFSGSLVLQGDNGQLLTIASTSSGSKANIALLGSGTFRQNLDYLDVSDSDAGSGQLLYCLETENGCNDGGNNTNWMFNAVCGDSIVHEPEDCDLGGANSNSANAACRTDCSAQRCGDGVQDTGEFCDDGNESNTDNCLNTCVAASCGDTYVQVGEEQCEPPDTTTCASNCIYRTGGGGTGNNGGGGQSSAAQSYSRRSAPPAGCGNGLLQTNLGEECDAGVYNGVGTCSYACKLYYCGDNVVSTQIGEDCEPPKVTTSTNQLVFAPQTCGKICSIPTVTEEGGIVGGCKTVFLPACGVSSVPTTSSVASVPQAAVCGNGTVENGEECDGEDGCSTSCVWNICGDGMVNQEGEECDNGSVCENNSAQSCRSDSDCPDSRCLYNSDKDPFCSALCALEAPLPSAPTCGDGVKEGSEECDDANEISGDGCSLFCQVERNEVPGTVCGNTIVEQGEQCDTGASNSDSTPNMCRMDCSNPTCGDNVVDTDEECDQGTLNSSMYGDRCRRDCKLPRCGDGIIDSSEYCDGGITCRQDCTGLFATACGNGKMDRGEECDDGNTVRGDGCNVSCRIEEEIRVRPAAPDLRVRPRLPVKVKPAQRTLVRPAAPRQDPAMSPMNLPTSPLLPTLTGVGVGKVDQTITASAIVAMTGGVILLRKKQSGKKRKK